MPQAFPYVPVQDPTAVPLDYAQMLGIQPQAPQVAAPQYAPMMQPAPEQNVEALYHQPTTNLQEIETRKAGWLEVIQRLTSDPNLMRAVGMFGAQAMQPLAPGQTTMGHLGNAWMVGRSAYDFGKDAEFQRAMLARREGRAEESHRATMETHAATLPGVRAESSVKVATVQDQIDKAKLEVDRTRQLLENAKSEGEAKKIELEAAKRREAIIRALPEGTEKNAIIAEFKKAELENNRIIAATKASGAQAAAASATAAKTGTENRILQQEEKDLAAMTPEERRAYRARKGQTSAQVQMADRVQALYRQANPTATPQQAAQAALDFFKDKKTDDLEQYLKFTELDPPKPGETPDQHFKRFQNVRTLVSGGKTPTAPAPTGNLGAASAAAPSNLPRPSTQAEYDALPKGAQYIDSKGQVRTKAK